MKRVVKQSEDDPCLPPTKQSKSDAPRRGVYMCVGGKQSAPDVDDY